MWQRAVLQKAANNFQEPALSTVPILRKEATFCFKTSVNIYQTARRYKWYLWLPSWEQQNIQYLSVLGYVPCFPSEVIWSCGPYTSVVINMRCAYPRVYTKTSYSKTSNGVNIIKYRLFLDRHWIIRARFRVSHRRPGLKDIRFGGTIFPPHSPLCYPIPFYSTQWIGTWLNTRGRGLPFSLLLWCSL
jgi:hypothetical protein